MQIEPVYQKLEEFRQKLIGWHKTHEAREKLFEIKALLTEEEGTELSTAHVRLRMGEGAGDFNRVTARLISKYRQGPISGPGEKTLL